jgi:hypothetical protein
LSELPGILHGTSTDIAETLRGYRDRYGISYFTVMEFHADYIAEVTAALNLPGVEFETVQSADITEYTVRSKVS